MIAIRECFKQDCAALVPLLAALGHPAGEDEIRRRLRSLLSRGPGESVFVATMDGSVVGLVVLHMTPVLHKGADVARVTAIVVSERARRQGVGKLLMDRAQAAAREHGATRIELTSGHDRPQAHAFYRSFGYRDEGIRFAMELSEHPAPRPTR